MEVRLRRDNATAMWNEDDGYFYEVFGWGLLVIETVWIPSGFSAVHVCASAGVCMCAGREWDIGSVSR